MFRIWLIIVLIFIMHGCASDKPIELEKVCIDGSLQLGTNKFECREWKRLYQ